MRPKHLDLLPGGEQLQGSVLEISTAVGIFGTGSCLPDGVLTNRDLEHLVETSDEWIFTRTGMRERRIAAADQATSDLAATAARRALAQCGLAPEDVELLIVATVTPDQIACPPTACHVQRKIGAQRATGFDISAACSSFMNALMTSHHLVASGAFGNALVIGADLLSRITDYRDRESCVLFGDGAGAVVLGRDAARGQLLDHLIGIDGSGADMIRMPAGGSALPASHETIERRQHFLTLEGRKVFKFAVSKLCEIVTTIVERNGFTLDDIDLLVPHQANLRIIETAAMKLGIERDRVFVNIERYGNTSSASVPIALDEAIGEGRLVAGGLACLVAIGGGLSWGASLLRW